MNLEYLNKFQQIRVQPGTLLLDVFVPLGGRPKIPRFWALVWLAWRSGGLDGSKRLGFCRFCLAMSKILVDLTKAFRNSYPNFVSSPE